MTPAGGNWKELYNAAQNGNLELVQYHVLEGVDIDYQHPEFLTTPLIASIGAQHYEIAKFLLENGANPALKEIFGRHTPLSIAKFTKNQKLITLVQSFLYLNHPNSMKKIVVTGGNRGIGKAIAQQLLTDGYEVVITVRNEADGNSVVKELTAITGNHKLQFIQGDLSTIAQCQALVEKIKTKHPDTKVLINNAGVWMAEKKLNEDGLEMSFMVNYLAPYILSTGLTPILKKNQPARIVNVNAGLYIKGKLDIDKTPIGDDFSSIKTYANSKLCNTMFTIDYAKELEGSGITINAVHPGVINTGLGDSPKLLSRIVKVIKRFWKKPEYGAIAPVWLATSPSVEEKNGIFYNEKSKMPYTENALDDALRLKLQEKTEEILKKKL